MELVWGKMWGLPVCPNRHERQLGQVVSAGWAGVGASWVSLAMRLTQKVSLQQLLD